MEKNRHQDSETSGISWHPAFIEALQMELDAYRDILEFYPECQLTSEPLRIDCVIIKKKKTVAIGKNIAAMFRTWNLLEYKSPDDYVSVADFYKVYGYACLYASFTDAAVTDMTLTFIESSHPKKLLRHLREERGYTVAKTQPGIYTVSGDILPIQIIDSRQLSAEENVWLKSLSNRLDMSALSRINSAVDRLDKAARIAAYLDVIVRANAKTIEEAMKMKELPLGIVKALEETGWIAKAVEQKAEKIARNMVSLGLPFETIVSATQLDPEKVKVLYQ